MGKNSAKKDKQSKATSSGKKCSCLLFPGEKATDLTTYMKSLAVDVMIIRPPPGEAQNVFTVAGMLTDDAKEIVYKLINMVFRELDEDICFETLSADNLVVTADGLVKLRNDVSKDGTDSLKEQNVRTLGNLVDGLIAKCSRHYSLHRTTNPELRQLLGLLRRYRVGASTFFIRNHLCTVPLSNRSFYCILMIDHTLHIIRFNDPAVFEFVITGIEVPANWYHDMASNSILRSFLNKGVYDPDGSLQGTVPDLEPLNCMRNLPSHAREGAANALAEEGADFTRGDLARMLYTKAPMAMCSMAKALDAAGELSKTGVAEQFPGRLRVNKNT